MKKLFISILLVLLPIFALTPKLLLKDPPIWPDEVYFVSLAESINTTGHPSTRLYGETLPGSVHIRTYNYPPVYIYLLALWIHVFGSSIVAIRLLSVLLGLSAVLLFFFLIFRSKKSYVAAIVGTLALEFFPPFSMGVHIARMEILILLLFVASLFVYKRFFPVAVILGMLAFLSHPIGGFILVYLFLYIFFSQQKTKKILMFGSIVGLGLLWWFWEVHDYFELFVYQMTSLVSYKIAREPLLNLLFQRDLLWRSILLFYLLIGSIAIIQRKILWGVGAFIVIIVAIYGVDQWYFLFLPVFPILLATEYKSIIPVIVLVILHSLGSIPPTITHLQRNENYVSFSDGISKEIPEGKKVIISAIPDPHFVLINRPDLTLFQMPITVSKEQVETYIRNADIVVYNYATNPELPRYLQTHTEKKVTVRQIDGYEADVIFLKQ